MPVGTSLSLKRSIGGVVEKDTFAFQFAARLSAGETISTIVAVDQVCESGGPGPLTLGTSNIVGSQVQLSVTAPDNSPDGIWALSCTVTTSSNRTLVGSGGLEIAGSSGNG